MTAPLEDVFLRHWPGIQSAYATVRAEWKKLEITLSRQSGWTSEDYHRKEEAIRTLHQRLHTLASEAFYYGVSNDQNQATAIKPLVEWNTRVELGADSALIAALNELVHANEDTIDDYGNIQIACDRAKNLIPDYSSEPIFTEDGCI